MKHLQLTLALLTLFLVPFILGMVVAQSIKPRYAIDDLNHDGIVDIRDLSVFSSNYPKH